MDIDIKTARKMIREIQKSGNQGTINDPNPFFMALIEAHNDLVEKSKKAKKVKNKK